MDGETLGEVESESFSADSMTVTFQGFNTHPGYGKGRMINSIKIAADFITRLPKGTLSPETTGGYEGYVHPYVVNASVERTSVKLLMRDFKTDGPQGEGGLPRDARARPRSPTGRAPRSRCAIDESYRNMREVLDAAPAGGRERARGDPPRRARRCASARSAAAPTARASRSWACRRPNLFAGEHNFHSRLEWVSVQDMEKAVEVIVHLARVWEERAER